MNDIMVKILGLNWRSTLLGILAASWNTVDAYLKGTMNWKTFVVSLIYLIAGYILKDAKVTGNATNPRAQAIGQPTPIPSPAAEVEIKEIAEKRRTEE